MDDALFDFIGKIFFLAVILPAAITSGQYSVAQGNTQDLSAFEMI
jgi:hypothetical protein